MEEDALVPEKTRACFLFVSSNNCFQGYVFLSQDMAFVFKVWLSFSRYGSRSGYPHALPSLDQKLTSDRELFSHIQIATSITSPKTPTCCSCDARNTPASSSPPGPAGSLDTDLPDPSAPPTTRAILDLFNAEAVATEWSRRLRSSADSKRRRRNTFPARGSFGSISAPLGSSRRKSGSRAKSGTCLFDGPDRGGAGKERCGGRETSRRGY